MRFAVTDNGIVGVNLVKSCCSIYLVPAIWNFDSFSIYFTQVACAGHSKKESAVRNRRGFHRSELSVGWVEIGNTGKERSQSAFVIREIQHHIPFKVLSRNWFAGKRYFHSMI